MNITWQTMSAFNLESCASLKTAPKLMLIAMANWLDASIRRALARWLLIVIALSD